MAPAKEEITKAGAMPTGQLQTRPGKNPISLGLTPRMKQPAARVRGDSDES